MWDTSSIATSTAYPAFECILAVVPHPLVSISETAGGHEGRWECQPHNAESKDPQPSSVRLMTALQVLQVAGSWL